jgi:hypothetical protein
MSRATTLSNGVAAGQLGTPLLRVKTHAAPVVELPVDNSVAGAVWVYTRSNGAWTQQGTKLVGTGAVGQAQQGISVALSGDGNTVIVGGNMDNSNAGAAWVYIQPTVPRLQVTPATNIVAAGNQGGPFTPSSFPYQLSATAGSINYSISISGGGPIWLTASPASGNVSPSGTTVIFR